MVLSFAVDGPYYPELHEALQGEVGLPRGRVERVDDTAS